MTTFSMYWTLDSEIQSSSFGAGANLWKILQHNSKQLRENTFKKKVRDMPEVAFYRSTLLKSDEMSM